MTVAIASCLGLTLISCTAIDGFQSLKRICDGLRRPKRKKLTMQGALWWLESKRPSKDEQFGAGNKAHWRTSEVSGGGSTIPCHTCVKQRVARRDEGGHTCINLRALVLLFAR